MIFCFVWPALLSASVRVAVDFEEREREEREKREWGMEWKCLLEREEE